MKLTRSAALLATLAVGFLGLAGCANQKEPAEQAMASIEKTLEGSGAQLQKYLPERYQEISASVAALRENLAQEKYGDVVSGAPAVVDTLRRAVADAQIRRAQIRVELEAEWADLVTTMPAMLAAVDKKITAQGGRPPKGMDRDSYKSLIESYDAARGAWSKSAETIDAATFESAVVAARDAKTVIAGVMEKLGIKAS
ncbi:MAG: hypothetical protein ACRER4_04295 [Steroidobacteraceae bacterium]